MKFQPSHRRTLVVFCCGLILFVLWRQANHALASLGMSMWLGGLLVTFPALRIAPQQGFNAAIVLGLLVDSFSPTAFGLNAFLFGISHLVIVRIRNRLAADEPVIATVVALITNLILFLILSFIALSRNPEASISGLRLLTDLVLSQLAIGLCAGWFFALQERALALIRVGILDEPNNAY
jgi:cell shape-determining protein MreD